jgi:hypothetical protein
MAEAGTVVHIVGPQNSPHQFLEEVVFFIGALGRSEARKAFRPVLISKSDKSLFHQIQRFFPARLPESFSPADERLLQTIGMMDKLVGIPSFQAKLPPADRMIF